MTFSRISLLCMLTAASWASAYSVAEAQWAGGSPVFQSDVAKRQQQMETQRAERRKSYAPTKYPAFMKGGEKPDIAPEAPEIAYLSANEQPGTVIVDTGGRKLYYVLPGKRAYAYPISVGRDGFTWTGTERISRVQSWPTWTPPPEMRRRQPGLPVTVSGGLINPLGAKALYLGGTIYRIHGTNNARSIGRASSSGCFRMLNKHVIHLSTLAKIGTKVRVVKTYSGANASAPMASLFFGFGSEEPAAAEPEKKKSASAKKKSSKKTNTN